MKNGGGKWVFGFEEGEREMEQRRGGGEGFGG